MCVVYPSCFFSNVDEKHFLKILFPLTVFLHLCPVLSLLLLEIVLFPYTFVLIHLIFFAALTLLASHASFVPLITFKAC